MGTREYRRVLKSWGFWENGLDVAVGRENKRGKEEKELTTVGLFDRHGNKKSNEKSIMADKENRKAKRKIGRKREKKHV